MKKGGKEGTKRGRDGGCDLFGCWTMTLPVEKVRLAAPRLCPRLMAATGRSPTHTRTHSCMNTQQHQFKSWANVEVNKHMHVSNTPLSSAELLSVLWEEGFLCLTVQVPLLFGLSSCSSKCWAGCWNTWKDTWTHNKHIYALHGQTRFHHDRISFRYSFTDELISLLALFLICLNTARRGEIKYENIKMVKLHLFTH